MLTQKQRDATDEEELNEQDDEAEDEHDELDEKPETREGPEPVSVPSPEPIVPDRYEITNCTIHISITMLENDGHEAGRMILLGIRNDSDIPMIRMVRLSELVPLPEPIAALLAQLEADLPQRKQAMQESLAQAQREQAKGSKKKQRGKPAQSDREATPVATAPVVVTTVAVKTDAPPQPQPVITSKRKAKEETEKPFEQMSLF